MKSQLTVLCYIKQDNKYLMLHRIKKEKDINKDKWIGVGGHFEQGESPEECLLREVKEETGLDLIEYSFRGIVTFQTETGFTEYMCLYEGYSFHGEIIECDEGQLEWVDIGELIQLNLWEGDYIFLDLLANHIDFFSLKLVYNQDVLTQAVLDGKDLELFDLCDETGQLTGRTRERNLAHRYGSWHRTSHVWVVKGNNDSFDVLLQKRSEDKDSYPGCYDISSAGHIPTTYDFLESAVRELEEELGLVAKEEDLVQIGTRKIVYDEVFNGIPFLDRQISNIYLLEMTLDIEDMKLQESEVEGVIWMDIDECVEGVEKNKFKHCIYLEEILMVKKWCENN